MSAVTARWLLVLAALSCAVGSGPVVAQQVRPSTAPLFVSNVPLRLTITADFDALRRDRRESPERPATFVVNDPDASEVTGSVRTRGNFRLDPANCTFPPLRLDVNRRSAIGTVLEGQDKLKLVSSCRPGREAYDRLVLSEYLTYRTYQLLSELSLSVRLLDLTLVDTSGERESVTRVAFLIEEDEALAERAGATVFDLEEGRNLPPEAFEVRARTAVAVFQYMIGNADWSDVAGHNVEILERGGGAWVVPYDFDSSGLVDAPYATVNPDFGLRDVTERLYRGFCTSPFTTSTVLSAFRERRDAVLALWDGAQALDDATRRRSLRYLETFYEDIETDDRARSRFLRDCRSGLQ